MANFAELLDLSGKTQVWVTQLTGESRQVVNNWYTGRTKKLPEKHREALLEHGLWPTTDSAPTVAHGISVENVRDAWLVIGQAIRESGRDIWMIDQGALGIYFGTMADGLSKGESFEALKGRLLERARAMVAGLHRPAQ